MPTAAIKPQANFYPLSKVVKDFNLPLTVQVIPTKSVQEFSSNKHHKVTLLCQQVTSNDVNIKEQNDVQSTISMTDDEIRIKLLDNSKTYRTIDDVIKCRKSDELEYVAVMSKCVYEDNVLDIGDILFLRPASKRLSLVQRNRKQLNCTVLPDNRKIVLPDTLQIELRKCVDYNEKRESPISEIVYSRELPCLGMFGYSAGFSSIGSSLSNQTVLIKGQSVENVVIGCFKDPIKGLQIHVFPTDSLMDLEILHGEHPVVEFTKDELILICERVKEKVDGNGHTHHKFLIEEMDLYDYTDLLEEREDFYENCGFVTNNENYESSVYSELNDSNDYPVTLFNDSSDQMLLSGEFSDLPVDQNHVDVSSHGYVNVHKGSQCQNPKADLYDQQYPSENDDIDSQGYVNVPKKNKDNYEQDSMKEIPSVESVSHSIKQFSLMDQEECISQRYTNVTEKNQETNLKDSSVVKSPDNSKPPVPTKRNSQNRMSHGYVNVTKSHHSKAGDSIMRATNKPLNGAIDPDGESVPPALPIKTKSY
ncbi:uncharacterized protein [Clytia hemisphaerica]|uniref:CABIT domain-containing protein n=1 Tax=Clytia hemisphaerica TaxID=252671 RepID=A0A7M5XE67_9CNID